MRIAWCDELAAVVAGALPVAVGDLGHHLAALLDGFEHDADVELLVHGGLHADFDVVEIDEDSDLQSGVCHGTFLLMRGCHVVRRPNQPATRRGTCRGGTDQDAGPPAGRWPGGGLGEAQVAR